MAPADLPWTNFLGGLPVVPIGARPGAAPVVRRVPATAPVRLQAMTGPGLPARLRTNSQLELPGG